MSDSLPLIGDIFREWQSGNGEIKCQSTTRSGIFLEEQIKAGKLNIDMDVVKALLAEGRKHQQKIDEANALNRQEPPRLEFNKLRMERYRLEQAARSTETQFNNIASNVKMLEKNIIDLLTEKKKATTDGMLGAERHAENRIMLAENELCDELDKLNLAKRANAHAARDLKAWPHAERLKELEKIVG